MAREKIKTRRELGGIIEKEKASGKTIGFTNGCFDIIHAGHVRYLGEARSECDLLIVGVNSDSSVKSIKGEDRPLNKEEARMEVLAALESVDYLTLFEEDTPLDLIKEITPDILFKGGDWNESEIAGGDHVKACGGKVRLIQYIEGHSTTGLIDKIRKK